MKHAVFLGLLTLTACGGAASESATPFDEFQGASCTDSSGPEVVTQRLASITVNGVTREFRVSIPAVEAGTAMPIVMAFHGGGGRDYPFEQNEEIDALGDQEDFITVYPLAELISGNEGEWQLNTASDSRQDIEFVEAIIDGFNNRYCVDTSRVYAVGYSLGGMFVYDLACQLNMRFSAIASFAGTMPVETNSCVMEDTVGILHVHGQRDSIIPYSSQWDWKAWDEVGTMMDIPSLVDFWGEKYNCASSHEDVLSDGLYRSGYSSCDGGALVEHFRRDNGDHEWPWNIGGVSTPEVIWQFFSQFSKP